MAAELNVIIRNILADTLKNSAPGLSEVMREAVANSLTMKLAAAIMVPVRPFYGAECPSYPTCTGGCGLGCTKEIERNAARREGVAADKIVAEFEGIFGALTATERRWLTRRIAGLEV